MGVRELAEAVVLFVFASIVIVLVVGRHRADPGGTLLPLTS
jgi:hypothetical protein